MKDDIIKVVVVDKIRELEKIAREIEKCNVCKEGKIGKAVPGEGNPNARIVFIGEAPGVQESKTGRPFVGRSGKYLRSLIRKIGIKEEDVYITSPVKYLPKRGTPAQLDIDHGGIHLLKQIEIINPKLIVLLGNVAFQTFFDDKPSVSSRHGEIINQDNRNYFITFHPAAAIRFEKIKKQMKEDFKKLKKVIDKTTV